MDTLISGHEYVLVMPHPKLDTESGDYIDALARALEQGGAKVVGTFVLAGMTRIQFVDVTETPDLAAQMAEMATTSQVDPEEVVKRVDRAREHRSFGA